jgi:[acyl-carrier-protein] S-malonyltransferase
MKRVLIFPGQGSQSKGMGEDILENFSKGHELMDEAKNILGYDLEDLIMNDREDQLNQTQYTQPALFTVSVIYTEYLREKGVTWQAVAGHSLGEYAALYAADVYSFSEGLTLVARRGELMEKINDESLGMAAILGLTEDEVIQAVEKYEGLYIANLNSPVQTVLSGKKESITSLGAFLKETGKGRLIPLRVKGAFHSPYMKPVEEKFQEAVDNCHFKNPLIDVYPNVLGHGIKDSMTLKKCLIDQVSGQVRWTETVRNMEKDGITNYFEAGPGKVLDGLMKKCTSLITPLEL